MPNKKSDLQYTLRLTVIRPKMAPGLEENYRKWQRLLQKCAYIPQTATKLHTSVSKLLKKGIKHLDELHIGQMSD